MLQRALFIVGGVASLVVFIWIFGAPKQELKIVWTRRPPQTTPQQPISETTAVPVQRPISLHLLQQALAKAGHPQSTGFQRWGRLPTGETLISLADGKAPNEHRLPGKLYMLRDKQGQWRPFLGGRSLFQIRTAKSGWVAALTAENQLILVTPQGQEQFKLDQVGLHPRFSPSGNHLVYIHKQSIAHNTLIWRDLATGQQKALVSRGPLSNPVVSPSEDAVIYASGKSGYTSLWKVTHDGQETQLSNRGLTPGTGGRPAGFVPPPAGRYPVLWANHWLVYDAGDGLWAIRDDGTQAHLIIAGDHRPQWDIPGVSVVYLLHGKRTIAMLPKN